MLFNHFLVAAEFDCAVATDALVPVRCGIVIKHIRGKVEHAVVGVSICDNILVDGRFFGDSVQHFGSDELAVVDISLVYTPEIQEAQHGT